ncbi:hypothetical protein GJ698_10885 [Pseudoduganella sp. FT26W]|uniref:Pilus assembly protein n=1 Tax=Duganella aquatilis TaxID=2666082 RepID=A0A844DAC4_9BURK|nr:TadE family protein [Duganella aquatilis]MRW84590.1 hypothetical protein [Duganella aquatilis]
MKPHRRAARRGSVLIELSLALPALCLIMLNLIFVGVVLFNYEMGLKAAHDAASYLASAEQRDMKNSAAVGGHVAVARAIVAEELQLLSLGPYPPSITVSCNMATCSGYSVPSTVSVTIEMRVVPSSLIPLSSLFFSEGITLTAVSTLRYIGT